uniref:Spondin-like TSP1 domain-containing protein n=1 Tax=viral metagenome TaxID=1070528 RepID=A0A6C0CT81_9ZZZZ
MGNLFSSTTSSAESSTLSSANTSSGSLDCQLSPWVSVGTCNVSCGGGIVYQTRQITKEAGKKGVPCPSVDELTQNASCNTQPCPINCSLSLWKDGECNVSCGGGMKRQTRTVLVQNAYGGSPCTESLTQNVSCNSQPCPIDCVTGEWKDASECNAPCGIGSKIQTLPIITQALYGGIPCPISLSQNVSCNIKPCPVDCVTGTWTDTTQCSVSCGGGTKRQILPVLSPYSYGGHCPTLTQEVACNIDRCPVDCVTGPWTDSTDCNVSCGNGSKTQIMAIITPAAYGGLPCPTNLSQIVPCSKTPCPSNCILSEWRDTTQCSVACGGGTKTQSASIVIPAAYGGTCPNLVKTVPCNTQTCPVDCVLDNWRYTSECSVNCGGGTRTRELPIITQSNNLGNACPVAASLTEIVPCNTQPCPVNCVTGPWIDSSVCSATCGGGTKTQSMTVVIPAAYGGTPCPTLTQTIPCNTQKCPVDCVTGTWSDSSECSLTCGGGSKTQTLSVITQPANNGIPCPVLTHSVSCNEQHCPVDCVTGQWTDSSVCSATCGGGTKTQILPITIPASYGGRACPTILTRTSNCNPEPCPVNCVVGTWDDTSPCTVACGGGLKTQRLSIITPSVGTGTPCPHEANLSQTVACNTQHCPVDCVPGDWADTTACNVQCGTSTGLKTQMLPLLSSAAYGGRECTVQRTRTQTCTSTKVCPINYLLGVSKIIIDGYGNCGDIHIDSNMIATHDPTRCAISTQNRNGGSWVANSWGIGVSDLLIYDKFNVAVVTNRFSPNISFTNEFSDGGCTGLKHTHTLKTPTDISKFVIHFNYPGAGVVTVTCYDNNNVIVYASKKIFLACYQQNVYVFDFTTNIPNYLITPLLQSNSFIGETWADVISITDKGKIFPNDSYTPADLKCYDSCAYTSNCQGIIYDATNCVLLSNITNITPVIPSVSFGNNTNASTAGLRRNFFSFVPPTTGTGTSTVRTNIRSGVVTEVIPPW